MRRGVYTEPVKDAQQPAHKDFVRPSEELVKFLSGYSFAEASEGHEGWEVREALPTTNLVVDATFLRSVGRALGRSRARLWLVGPEAAGKTTLVTALRGELAENTLVVDTNTLGEHGASWFRTTLRHAAMYRAALLLDCTSEIDLSAKQICELRVLLESFRGPVVFISTGESALPKKIKSDAKTFYGKLECEDSKKVQELVTHLEGAYQKAFLEALRQAVVERIATSPSKVVQDNTERFQEAVVLNRTSKYVEARFPSGIGDLYRIIKERFAVMQQRWVDEPKTRDESLKEVLKGFESAQLKCDPKAEAKHVLHMVGESRYMGKDVAKHLAQSQSQAFGNMIASRAETVVQEYNTYAPLKKHVETHSLSPDQVTYSPTSSHKDDNVGRMSLPGNNDPGVHDDLPKLVKAPHVVEKGVVGFLLDLGVHGKVTGGGVEDLTEAEFSNPDHENRRSWESPHAVDGRTHNKTYIKDQFRSAAPGGGGHHEWIPSDQIGEIVGKAATLDDNEEAAKWVRLQHELRSETGAIIFRPGDFAETDAAWENDDEAAIKSMTAALQSAMTGHVGALYLVDSDNPKRPVQKTAGTEAFHKAFRRELDSYDGSAKDYLKELRVTALGPDDDGKGEVWNGDLAKLPRAFGRLGAKIKHGFVDSKGEKLKNEKGEFAETLKQLGERQEKKFEQIQGDFDDAD